MSGDLSVSIVLGVPTKNHVERIRNIIKEPALDRNHQPIYNKDGSQRFYEYNNDVYRLKGGEIVYDDLEEIRSIFGNVNSKLCLVCEDDNPMDPNGFIGLEILDMDPMETAHYCKRLTPAFLALKMTAAVAVLKQVGIEEEPTIYLVTEASY